MTIHPTTTKQRASKAIANTAGFSRYDPSLDDIAKELTELSHKFLPDNALQGAYAGHEADMRQEAIVLALGWYLRNRMDPDAAREHSWHAPRAIAAALQIQRRDYAKSRKKELTALHAMPPGWQRIPRHPSLDGVCDWSASTMTTVLRHAIKQALAEERITAANAAVALGVMVDGVHPSALAKRLGIHRSAVYQHLGIVRRALPDLIDGIEMPLHDYF